MGVNENWENILQSHSFSPDDISAGGNPNLSNSKTLKEVTYSMSPLSFRPQSAITTIW